MQKNGKSYTNIEKMIIFVATNLDRMNLKRLLFVCVAILGFCAGMASPLRVKARFLSAENGLGSNYIRNIVQDGRGYIWMSSTNGLIRYDGYTATLLLPDITIDGQPTRDSRIQTVRLWKDRYLLLLLRGPRYSCYDTYSERFVTFTGDCKEILSSRPVDQRGNAVSTTTQGEVTVGRTTLTGLYDDRLLQLNGSPRYGVLTDRDGMVWVSTYGNGLFAHDPQTGETVHFLKSADNVAPIQTNYLLGIYEDRAGNIWVSQENMGVACISKQKSSVRNVFFTTADDMDHTNSIHLLARIGDRIFVGNSYNGLRLADGRLNFTETVTTPHDDVVAVCADKNGQVWAGTRRNGIYVSPLTDNPLSGKNLRHDEADPSSLLKGKISDIMTDHQGRVWISIFDAGVDMAEPDGKGGYRFRHFFTGQQTIMHPRKLFTDHAGYIWLCADDGLYTFHPDRLVRNPKDYDHLLISEASVNTNETHCIYETSDHRLLVGTLGGGLAELDNRTAGKARLTTVYTTVDGLPNNNVQQITSDSKGNVWIGTDYGLVCWDIRSCSFRTLLPAGTPLGNMFVVNACCPLADGTLAFGTHHGIVIINPNSLPVQERLFPLRITGLDINGSEGVARDTTLAYNQNTLTFRFSGFEYAEDRHIRYSYRLTDYDEQWSPMSEQHQAIYRNLPPGSYTMEVRTQDSDSTAVLTVVIQPPFWATWWAYLIYIGVVVGIVIAVYRHFKRVNDLNNRILVENQLTEYKMRFFTNVSHEFRTPLTIIRGAMERICKMDRVPGEMKQPLFSMQKSVDRLMRMINQLLEFSKMHENKLRLAVEKTEVVSFTRNIYATFKDIAEGKQMNYLFTTSIQRLDVLVDRSFLDKILYNLISNAFKYTPEKREVMVRVKLTEEQRLLFIVEDTGVGIPKGKQEELFTRFNQSAFSQDSIGIGLHLTQELVRVHHGTITYQEHPKGGSIFTVSLPVDEAVYSEEERMQRHEQLVTDDESANAAPQAEYREMLPVPINRRNILVVEDDHDIRQYLQHELQRYFVVETASNGEEALEKIEETRPELIVSDVMMPVMNGYELTRKVRARQETADIPIIMLTALDSDKNMMKGINSGAEAYLQKPFSPAVLITLCSRMIEQRDRLKTAYAKEIVKDMPTPEVITDAKDQRLREQLEKWMYAHLSDPQLNIDAFAQSMGYGRTTFFKKVKQLTGMTPNDYIKTARMNKAIELLKEDRLTIAEIAYKVGFDDQYYFSKSFKQFFGMPPSKFRNIERPAEA